MDIKIFCDYGITLVDRDGKIFALLDSGELVPEYLEAEINEAEAEKVQKKSTGCL